MAWQGADTSNFLQDSLPVQKVQLYWWSWRTAITAESESDSFKFLNTNYLQIKQEKAPKAIYKVTYSALSYSLSCNTREISILINVRWFIYENMVFRIFLNTHPNAEVKHNLNFENSSWLH